MGTEVVPLLPENVGVRVAAVVALALGWVATIVRVVSRVTPVPESQRGLLPANLATGGRVTGPPSSGIHLRVEGGTPTVDAIVAEIHRRHRHGRTPLM